MKSLKGRFDNENLISLVRDNPLLYNPFLKNYRNKHIRYLTWQKIANILDADIESCQKRWRTLRDTYKKEKSGTLQNKKPWEYFSLMTFMDEIYQEHSNARSRKTSKPALRSSTSRSVQPLTSEPVIVTVPNKKTLRPIAPKGGESSSDSTKSLKHIMVNEDQESNTENESVELLLSEPDLYLVTPTLLNDQERTLFKKSINTSKRKANFSNDNEEDVVEGSMAKRAAIEEEAMLRRQEFECRLQWEEKEHSLRVKCQEEEHQIKMKVEQAKLQVEEENLKLKQQKLLVLRAKEAYFKSLIKTGDAD